LRRVAVRDERTWESSCEYGLFRSPAMAVSVDAVPPPATPRGLHPRQRASFLQGWSNTTLRGGTLRSSRGHYLAPPPVGMSRVGSFASRSVLSAGSARTRARARVRSRPPRRPSRALVSTVITTVSRGSLTETSREWASTFCFRVAESRPETTRPGVLDAHRAPRGTPDVPLPTKEGIKS
jgi:hypothetical protein